MPNKFKNLLECLEYNYSGSHYNGVTSFSLGGEEVKKVLKKETNFNAINEKGATALMLASFNGDTKTAKSLILRGADVNIQNNIGASALLWATVKGHTTIVQALIESNAELNIICGEKTPLMWACENSFFEIVKLLINAGADISIKNEQQEMALDIAKSKYQLSKNEIDKDIVDIIKEAVVVKQMLQITENTGFSF